MTIRLLLADDQALVRGAHRRRRRDPVESGHLHVEQRHVGVVLEDGRHHGVTRADLGDHLQVGLEVEQRRERTTHQGLVVGEEEPNHGTRTRSA